MAAFAGAAPSKASAVADASSISQSEEASAYTQNPYAVVRGGICAPSNTPGQEAASRKRWEALLTDPFWRWVFSDADPKKFHLIKTSLPLHRYVTYWKMKNGQVIHWTGKEILIPAGTRVFTDGGGSMYLCACGNQVSAVLPPKTPATVLPPEDEPPLAYLVPPEPMPFPVSSTGVRGTTPMASPPEVATPPTALLSPPPVFAGPPPVSTGPPPVIIVGNPRPGAGPGQVLNPGSPIVQLPVVPEPSTFSLTLIGLAALFLVRVFTRR